jgi:hypothetical protein
MSSRSTGCSGSRVIYAPTSAVRTPSVKIRICSTKGRPRRAHRALLEADVNGEGTERDGRIRMFGDDDRSQAKD